jgi:hypothetical protein
MTLVYQTNEVFGKGMGKMRAGRVGVLIKRHSVPPFLAVEGNGVW